MIKSIHLFCITLFVSAAASYAQDSIPAEKKVTSVPAGYYQLIDINADTPCNCNEKTDRTRELSTRLLDGDVKRYTLYAYKFSFTNSSIPAAKLFKALEKDKSVYKVSMKEWSSFMLLTTDQFDHVSFEKAAAKAFTTFSSILPEDFLKVKNLTSYNEYVEFLKNKKMIEDHLRSQQSTH